MKIIIINDVEYAVFAANEGSVILEGSKTARFVILFKGLFESSVILEGSKTFTKALTFALPFESSVILEGSKTI